MSESEDSAVLKSIDAKTYARSPIPASDDDALYQLFARFATDDVTENHAPKFSTDEEWVAAIFAKRMAVLGVRERDENRIRTGLRALTLLRGAIDLRDAIIYLAPLYDAASRINADADAMFRSFSRYSAPIVPHIVSFPDRTPEARSLAAMGFVVAQDESGFTYKKSW